MDPYIVNLHSVGLLAKDKVQIDNRNTLPRLLPYFVQAGPGLLFVCRSFDVIAAFPESFDDFTPDFIGGFVVSDFFVIGYFRIFCIIKAAVDFQCLIPAGERLLISAQFFAGIAAVDIESRFIREFSDRFYEPFVSLFLLAGIPVGCYQADPVFRVLGAVFYDPQC